MFNFNDKVVIVYILALAVVVRVAAIFILGSPIIWEYEEIANNILAGEGFKYSFMMAQHLTTTEPLYPYLTSLVYSVTGVNHVVMIIIQICFSVLLSLIIYLIGKSIFNLKTGLIASFIVATHPAFIYYDVKNLHPLTLGAMFIALSLWMIILLKRKGSLITASLTGLTFGVGTLARGTVGSFFILGALWLFFQPNKKKYIILLTMLACFAMTISPWVIRNYIQLKKIVPIRSTVYVAFWYGNNENATGSAMNTKGQGMLDLMPDEMKKRIFEANEIEQGKIFKNEALKFIRNNPRRFVELTAKKALSFLWFSPIAGFLYPKSYTFIYKVFYLIFFLLFLAGIFMTLKSSDKEISSFTFLFMLLFISVMVVHALTYVDCRHRWGIEPLMALFVSFSIFKIYNLIKVAPMDKYSPTQKQ